MVREQACSCHHEMDESMWQIFSTFYLVHSSHEWIQTYCHVGNTAQQCQSGLFQYSDFTGDLEDSKSTSGGILCIFGSHTFVPRSWMCKKQTSVSHRSTEAEIIYLDPGLRMDGSDAAGSDARKAVAAVLWRVARGSWIHEDRDEGSQQWKGTETRLQPATGARQTEKLSAREWAEGLMKHVPNGREDRKTARNGFPGPRRKQPGIGPKDPWKKEQCQRQASGKSLCPDRQWFDCASNGEGCDWESDAIFQFGKARVGSPCLWKWWQISSRWEGVTAGWPTIEKTVEVHQLQFSYQVLDVQLSHNDESL